MPSVHLDVTNAYSHAKQTNLTDPARAGKLSAACTTHECQSFTTQKHTHAAFNRTAVGTSCLDVATQCANAGLDAVLSSICCMSYA
jgi:hypothetical protein